jgi:hypothetical protein
MNYSECCYQIGYAILSHTAKPRAKRLNDWMDHMAKNTTADWDCLDRAMKIMEEGFKKEPSPIAKQFSEIVMKDLEREFNLDMIKYCINYDGFRL